MALPAMSQCLAMCLHLADMPVRDVDMECARVDKWLACRQWLHLGYAVRAECAATHVPNASMHMKTTVKLNFSCMKGCQLQLCIKHWSEMLVGIRSTCRLHESASNISFELWDFQLHSLIQYMQQIKPPLVCNLSTSCHCTNVRFCVTEAVSARNHTAQGVSVVAGST